MNKITSAIALLVLIQAAHAGKREVVDVTIVDKQAQTGTYTYVVPGYSSSTTTATANCVAGGFSANCVGSSQTTGISTPGYAAKYEVQGATLALRLPDGRTAVVNCNAKVNWTELSNPNLYRDCRVPPVAQVKVEFNGEKAKLMWPVSIDGKKMTTEVYKIVGILDAQ